MSTGVAAGLRPGLAALRRRDLPAVRGDVLAGVTVAAYLVPQVLAYAEVAGLAAVTGLWTAVAALGAYVVFGSSRQLSVGPESTTAIMTAVALAPLAAGDGGRYAALAGALALLVGALCLLGRLARLGFLADLLSRPVLVGYLTGIALIMISGQLEKITGVPVDGDTFVAELLSFAANIGQVHLPTLLLSAAVLAFLLVGAKLFPRAPIPLLAVLLAAGATALLTADALGVRVVGSVPQGIPVPALPSVTITDLTDLLLPAVGVAIVAYSDNVLTGRAFATRNSYPLDADQEMLALGAANVAAGLLQGFPVSSSGSRTVIGDSLGSRSQLSSIVTLLLVVVVLFVGGPVLAAFPTAALGALVVYAATAPDRTGRVPPLRPLPALRAGAGRGHDGRGAGAGCALRGARRGRTVHPGPAAPGLPPARSGARFRPRARRHARRRRPPGHDDRARPRRLPLRRAAVLRQRRELPRAAPSRPSTRHRPRSGGWC